MKVALRITKRKGDDHLHSMNGLALDSSFKDDLTKS